jgi:hypothetical protein
VPGGGGLFKEMQCFNLYCCIVAHSLRVSQIVISLLLQQMIDPNPEVRPSAIGLIWHRVLSPSGNVSQAQLHRGLNAEKLKTEIVTTRLENAETCSKCDPAGQR